MKTTPKNCLDIKKKEECCKYADNRNGLFSLDGPAGTKPVKMTLKGSQCVAVTANTASDYYKSHADDKGYACQPKKWAEKANKLWSATDKPAPFTIAACA